MVQVIMGIMQRYLNPYVSYKNYDNSPVDPGDHINDILWKGPERNVEVSDVYYYIYIIDYILVGVFRIPIILRVLHSV